MDRKIGTRAFDRVDVGTRGEARPDHIGLPLVANAPGADRLEPVPVGPLAFPRAAEHRARIARFFERGPRRLRLDRFRSEEHTSELQSLMRISYAVFCLEKKKTIKK